MLRKICERCSRPFRVCVCDGLPESLIELKTKVIILSDPDEIKKKTFGTVPLI